MTSTPMRALERLLGEAKLDARRACLSAAYEDKVLMWCAA